LINTIVKREFLDNILSFKFMACVLAVGHLNLNILGVSFTAFSRPMAQRRKSDRYFPQPYSPLRI
jgi:hypothetical protein